ncbi:hypothetical protein CSKR_103666 [Clonorchis sinensis]|uniref:Uncharacterized protein n=1 Tax=Clonorchis sinensis TaxID=79923 RepID=A0A3R7JKJ7_CLOSI|nr:hypothetical protein CSKR_103666 [Clonorchis sinensis]
MRITRLSSEGTTAAHTIEPTFRSALLGLGTVSDRPVHLLTLRRAQLRTPSFSISAYALLPPNSNSSSARKNRRSSNFEVAQDLALPSSPLRSPTNGAVSPLQDCVQNLLIRIRRFRRRRVRNRLQWVVLAGQLHTTVTDLLNGQASCVHLVPLKDSPKAATNKRVIGNYIGVSERATVSN